MNVLSTQDDGKEPLINYLWKNIPNLGSIMLINNEGDIIHQKTSAQFEKEHDVGRLKYIARKVSVRFKIVDFDKELGGLAMTINVFKGNTIMLVRSLNPTHLIIMMMPIRSDISTTMNVMKDVKEWPIT